MFFLLNNKSSLQTCSCRHTYAAKSQLAPEWDLNHTIVRHTVGRGNSAVNTCFAETEINLTRIPLVETACRIQITWKTKPRHRGICRLLLLSKLPHHFRVCACLLSSQFNKYFVLTSLLTCILESSSLVGNYANFRGGYYPHLWSCLGPGTWNTEGEVRFHTYYSNYGQPLFASLKYLRHHHHV